MARTYPDGVTMTVVVPAWNNWHLTHRCLSSIRRTSPRETRVIVADNGSTDATARELERLHPTVQVVRHAENLGFARGCNSALPLVPEFPHSLLLYLNNDAELLPRWWQVPVARFLDECDLGIVGAQILDGRTGRINHLGMAFSGVTLGESAANEHLARLRSPSHLYRGARLGDLPPAALLRPRDLQAVTGACMMVRATLAHALGGFDESYRNGWEDVDLCFRARLERGYRVSIEPTMRATHLEGQTPGRYTHEAANATLFAERWADRIEGDLGAILHADREAHRG